MTFYLLHVYSILIFVICASVLFVYSRTLDDAPHYDTNTEINTSRYTCHKCAYKSIINMLKILVSCILVTLFLVVCEKMHMVLAVVLDWLSQLSYPNPALAFQARAGFRHLC